MKHTTDYKFSDKITSVEDFFDALETAYSIGTIEKRNLGNKLDHYELTIYQDDGPNVQYDIYSLDDCLSLTTSRIDFMYYLTKRGYLAADC